MAVEALKTLAITQLDAAAAGGVISGGGTGRSASGFGAEGFQKEVNGTVAPTAGTSVGSTYQMARVPSNAVIKHIYMNSFGTFTAGAAANIGLYYSDSLGDGTAPALRGTVLNVDLFANGLVIPTALVAGTPVEVTYKNQSAGKYGNLSTDLANQPLWQAAGLTADPGGYFDIVLTMTVGSAATGSLAMFVQFQTWGQ